MNATSTLAALAMAHAELPALSDEALWDWPRHAATTPTADLASLCEPAAQTLLSGEPGAAADDDAPQALTLQFVYGIALLELAERRRPAERPELLQRAVHCLGRALTLARRHRPERVVPIKTQLYRAEHALVERAVALPA